VQAISPQSSGIKTQTLENLALLATIERNGRLQAKLRSEFRLVLSWLNRGRLTGNPLPSSGITTPLDTRHAIGQNMYNRTLWGSVAHVCMENGEALVPHRVCIDTWPAAQRVWALPAIAYAKMRVMIRVQGKNRLKNVQV
jgi:hypothetical protein